MPNALAQPKMTYEKKKKKWRLLLLASPFILLVILFSYMPLFGWIYSFFNYKAGIPLFNNEFVGLKFYQLFFADKVNSLRVIKNTAIFALIGICLSPLPMIFAILLNEIKSIKYKKFVQTFTTIPNFIGWVIVFSLAFMIFSNDGALNSFLSSVGNKSNTSVLGDPNSVYWFQTAVGLWKSLGWSSIIYLAAITGIDQQMYEAASIDGAGRLKSILHITVPNLAPTYLVLLLLSIGNFVSVGFEQYLVFNNPLVADKIEVLDLYVYRIGLMGHDYSYGVAISVMKSVISITLLFIANGIAKKVRGTSLV